MKKLALVVLALVLIASLGFAQGSQVPIPAGQYSESAPALLRVNGDHGSTNLSATGYFGVDVIQPISIELTGGNAYLGVFVVAPESPYITNFGQNKLEWKITLDPKAFPILSFVPNLGTSSGNEIVLQWYFSDLGTSAGAWYEWYPTNYSTPNMWPVAGYEGHGGEIYLKCEVKSLTARTAGHTEFAQTITVAYKSI